MVDMVACHSGSEYAEYPLKFRFQGDVLAVDEVLGRWRSPAGKSFRVRAASRLFDLHFGEEQDQWRVEQLSIEIPISGQRQEPA